MASSDSIGHPVVTRADAKSRGLKRYFTGTPCKHEHLSERLTVNGSCVECSRLKQVRNYRENLIEERAKQKRLRDTPGYYEKRKAKRHAADPELARRVAELDAEMALRAEARCAGLTMYQSRRACDKCGHARRFTGDGKCVECNRINCAARVAAKVASDPARQAEIARRAEAAEARKAAKAAVSAAWRRVHDARQNAAASGDLTYLGKPCVRGHSGVRYTSGGSCYECQAAEAASARKKSYDAEYLERNRDRILARTKASYEANRHKRMASTKAWFQANPERRKAISQNYKHKRRAQEAGGMSTAELLAWKRAAKKVCYWCGIRCPKNFAIDHYEPLSRGGKHVATNLVIACKPCNSRKSARPVGLRQAHRATVLI